MVWSAQEARRSFSEVLRRAHDEGGQIVTVHGREAAAIVDIEEYRRLTRPKVSFTEYLLSAPQLGDEWADEFDAEVTRRRQAGRQRDLPDLAG
jgi:prevent-host-death family protein